MQAACCPQRHQAGAVGVARVPPTLAVVSAALAETCPQPGSKPWGHGPLALIVLVLLVQSDSPCSPVSHAEENDVLSCTTLVLLKERPKERAISLPWHCGMAARQKFPSSGKFQYFYAFILLSLGLQRTEISPVCLVWGFPVLSVGKTSPMFQKQWNASLWVSSALKGISVRVTLILGCCHLPYPPTLFSLETEAPFWVTCLMTASSPQGTGQYFALLKA